MLIVCQYVFIVTHYSIGVLHVADAGGKIKVEIEEISPGPDCILTQALTYPFHIIKIPKTEKEIEFVSGARVVECYE